MRHMLNTLYVMTQDSYLAKEGENLLLRVDKEVRFRIPVHNLEAVVCFGHVNVSPPLMRLCMDSNVAISFLTEHGAFQGRVVGAAHGNVLLRRRHYRMADDPATAGRLASRFVIGKLANSRHVLDRAIHDHAAQTARINEIRSALAEHVRTARDAAEVDHVRGIEGDASRLYFSVFDNLILQNKDGFFFRERSRRPPLDAMNSLLSFLYTLLMHDVRAALETVGLDSAVGFLHQDRPGRPSLALDMMEELRPMLADRLALTLVNRRQVEPAGFVAKESGGIIMDDQTRKKVLTAWQTHKQEEIRHPFLDEKIRLGLVPYAQSLLLARHVRGDIDDYPPFIWSRQPAGVGGQPAGKTESQP